MLLKKTGYTEVKTIPIKYENADGNYATSGNSDHYYECVIDDIPSDVDGDYEFNLQFYDNSENYYTGEESTKTYYVSIDSFPPVVQNKKISTCDDSNNSNKTAVKLEYTTADARFVGGDVWYRRAIPTSDANWDNWTQSTKDILDKEETSKVIEGLDFGTTYEFKTVYYDEAGNATKPYYFKRTTKPQGYDSSWVTVNTYEDSRCIKISTTKKPAGAQTTKLIYTTGVFGINEETITYNTATTNDFFIRNIDYAKTYKIKLVTENSEKIDDHRYENYSSSYIWNDKCETELSAQKTKPQGVTVSVGAPEYLSSSQNFKYKFTINGKKSNVTGVKYKYGYYSNGSLNYPTNSNYSGKITPTDNSSEFTLNKEFTLDPSKRYHFIFESYYDTEDNVCDPIVKKEFDFWTPPVIVKQNSFKCNSKTKTTAKLVWEKPEGDFSHYKIVWYKSGDSDNKLEAYVSKDETSFTVTNLSSNTSYYAYIFCCSYKNECYNEQYVSSYIYFTTTGDASDVPFKINTITIYQADKADSNKFLYVKIKDYSGTFKNITAKWVTQNSYTESYQYLLSRLKYSSTNASLTYSSYPIEMQNLTSDKTYYLQFFIQNTQTPVSDVFAVRPSFKVTGSTSSSTNYYYLKEYSYEVKSIRQVNLNIQWDSQFYTTPIKKIRWKKTGENPSNWKYQSFTSSTTIPLNVFSDYFTPGSTFDVEFCKEESSSGGEVYAAAFITIPTTPETIFASNLTASKWSYDSITLTWDQNADCDYYNVYKKDTLDSVLVADQINKESPSVTIRGLTSNTYYSFIVVCHKSGIEDTITSGDWTNSDTKSIKQNTNDKKIYINSVIQSGGGSTNIYLKFNGVQQSKGVKVYYKSEDETDWNSITIGNSSLYSITGLTPGLRYDIKVAALSNEINNVVQESFPATCVAYTRPDKPSINPSFTITSSSIRVSWSFPFSGKWSKALLSYSKTDTDSDFIPLKIIDYEDRNNFDSRYYELKNLESGTTYYFKLTCYIDEAMTLGTDSYKNGAKTYSQ